MDIVFDWDAKISQQSNAKGAIMRHSTINTITVAILLALGLSVAGIAHGHGGKTHASEAFSALQAAQAAINLFDRLIVSGKLPETWETGLESVNIEIREISGNREYVVKFKRTDGDPQNVFFYFDRQGEYAGSNFTGD